MELLFVILAFVLLLIGLLGAIIPMIPGPPLSFAGLLFLQWSGFGNFTLVFIIVWALITLAVTLMDYILPSIMTRKFGGSKAASIGSFLGLVAGIFIFPPWGMIIGPFLGAYLGELIHNHADGSKAIKAAFGAFFAFITGTGIKLIVCSLMLYYAAREIF